MAVTMVRPGQRGILAWSAIASPDPNRVITIAAHCAIIRFICLLLCTFPWPIHLGSRLLEESARASRKSLAADLTATQPGLSITLCGSGESSSGYSSILFLRAE